MRGNIGRFIATGVACLAVTATMASPALSDSGEVTRGSLSRFAAGLAIDRYERVAGRVQMVRTASDTTHVTLHVTGLDPDTAYPAHVHKLPCGTNSAGGHYMRDPNGAPVPPNEIWPAFTTDARGAASVRVTAGFRAGADAVSVVIHDAYGTKPKIACADLA